MKILKNIHQVIHLSSNKIWLPVPLPPAPPPPSTFTVVTKSINYPSCLQSVIVQKFLTDFRGDLEKKYTTKIILFCIMYHLYKRYFVICC